MLFSGIDLVDALREIEHAGAGEVIEDLFAAPLVLDDARLTQDRQVTRGGGDRATGRPSQFTGTHRSVPQSVDNGHATGVAEGLEDFRFAPKRFERGQKARTSVLSGKSAITRLSVLRRRRM